MISDIIFIITVFLTNVIQAITGFAGTLLAMPLSIHLIGVTEAKVILNAVVLVSCTSILIKSHDKINRQELIRIVLWMLIGVVAGMIIFRILPLNFLLVAYGVMIIVIAIRKLAGAKERTLGKTAQYVILLVAGLIHGMFVSGGALLVVYATMKLPNKDEFRATLAPVWLILNGMMLVTHVTSGEFSYRCLVLFLLCIVPVLLSTKIGNWLHQRISQPVFLRITYVLLLLSGILAIF